MKKTSKTKAPKQKNRKRKLFARIFSLFLLGNLFASHHHASAADMSLHGVHHYAPPQKERGSGSDAALDARQDGEKARALWSAAALLARPLLFEHEDCELFQGRKKIGNFGVFWPRRLELPVDSAFRRYVNSEKQKVEFIVDAIGAGPERDLTLYQMAQVYSFVHNTTVASGMRALNALKESGIKAAQAVMSRVDRIRGMKAPLKGLALRRKDEVTLGAGDMDTPISRVMANGKPQTLASLQAHYNAFVSRLGEGFGAEKIPVPERHVDATRADEPASDPI